MLGKSLMKKELWHSGTGLNVNEILKTSGGKPQNSNSLPLLSRVFTPFARYF
jgi:hypothetical protein